MNLDKYIMAYRAYEIKNIENVFAIIEGKKEPYPNNPDIDRLWFIGLKLWGRDFSDREYEIRVSGKH